MTTIIISRYAVIKAYVLEVLGVEPDEDVESMDEFAAKYLCTLLLRLAWAHDPSLLDDLRANDAAADACCECWEGGGTIEEGHVRLWP